MFTLCAYFTYSHEMSEHLIMQQVKFTPLPYPALHSATQCKPLCVMKPSRNSTCAVQVVEGGSAKRRQRSSKHQQGRRRSEERRKAKEWSLNTGEYTNHMIISGVVNTQINHCCCPLSPLTTYYMVYSFLVFPSEISVFKKISCS